MACRAAVYGALVNAPVDEAERKEKSDFVAKLCKYPGSPSVIAEAEQHILEAHAERLTEETGKKVTAEDIREGKAPRPKVLDMFAGGGAIPLEALRLGCEAYALDLNPVAHIIELCTLVYPQKYGKPDPNERGMTGPKNDKGETTWGGLAKEVEYWGKWVLEKVKAEIGDLYPPIPDPEAKQERLDGKEFLPGMDPGGALTTPEGYLTPVAYLWTRTVTCKNPACGATVPLVRQTWLCKKKNRYAALKMIAPKGKKRVRFEVVESDTENGLGFDPAGFSRGGNATCPFCGTVADSNYVKAEGQAGRLDNHQMMAVVCTRPGKRGKVYISADDLPGAIPNDEAIRKRIDELCERTGLTVPDEPIITDAKNSCWTPLYGLNKFSDLFNLRQMFSVLTFISCIKNTEKEIESNVDNNDKSKAIITYLSLLVGRISDYNSTGCIWEVTGEFIAHTFSRQAIPLIWDFVELAPFGNASGSPNGAIEWIIGVIESVKQSGNPSIVYRGSAMELQWNNSNFDSIISDPPYYDNVPYAIISDYFYVWQKRSLSHIYPEHFSSQGTPKKNEIVADATRHNGDRKKAKEAYENMMEKTFLESYRVLKPYGKLVIVYAHKTTLGWSTLIESLKKSGFIVTEAWPLDTERPGRLRDIDSSALASSIFLVARKREVEKTGSYEDDVLPELSVIVKERVNTLWKMGITGADLVIAAVGAGLRAFTKFSRVEYANGEEVPAEKMLADVEAAVLETLMEKIFSERGKTDGKPLPDGGLASMDGPTRFYILWRYTYRAAEMDAGEAIVFTYGQNVELDGPDGLSTGPKALIQKKKGKYNLFDYTVRGENEKLGLPDRDGDSAHLIDVLHRILWLVDKDPRGLDDFLDKADPDVEGLRLVANILAGAGLEGKSADEEKLITTTASESSALKKLLANWGSIIEGHLPKGSGPLFSNS